MKRHFTAAKRWDSLRRDRIRNEPNDPKKNRAALNHLIQMARRVNDGIFLDGPQEDESEIRLARILSRR